MDYDLIGLLVLPVFFVLGVLVSFYGNAFIKPFGAIGQRVIRFLGPSGCYVQPSVDEIIPVESDPTGLFLIDERCPGCLGTGRLRVNILEDDIDEERMWRELELTAHKKWDWEVARTCTGCGLPFLCSKEALRDFCGKGTCQKAYYDRGNRTLGTEALNG